MKGFKTGCLAAALLTVLFLWLVNRHYQKISVTRHVYDVLTSERL